MMKTRKIPAVLMVLALVASSFAVAYAGGMGAGLSITLVNCYVIHHGANSPYTLAVNDQFGVRQHVRLGKARLLCTLTTPGDFVDSNGVPIDNQGAVVERGPELTVVTTGDHLKCYDVVPRAASANTVVTITDPFGGAAGETVSLEGLSVLCAPADVSP